MFFRILKIILLFLFGISFLITFYAFFIANGEGGLIFIFSLPILILTIIIYYFIDRLSKRKYGEKHNTNITLKIVIFISMAMTFPFYIATLDDFGVVGLIFYILGFWVIISNNQGKDSAVIYKPKINTHPDALPGEVFLDQDSKN